MARVKFWLSRATWPQILVSLLIMGLGLTGAHALSLVDADLRIMYQEYALAAVDLAHISGDVLRYRGTILTALEASSKKEFETITASLPAQRARIQHAVDRYAAASLRVSRSGRSEPEDLEAVKQSLEAYFSAASMTHSLLIQVWMAGSPAEAADLRRRAEHHASDNAGPKLIQLSVALDHLLETVTDVAQDMRDEGTRMTEQSGVILTVGCFVLAIFNLLLPWRIETRRVGTPSEVVEQKDSVLASAKPPHRS
jgi:hypothetical protein